MSELKWLGNGDIPFRTPIEYRYASWPDSEPWRETQVKYMSGSLIVLDDNGSDAPYGPDSKAKMIFRPVGGVFVSEHEEFLRGVVSIVEATSHEKYFLWKEYCHDGKKVTWKEGHSGPIVTVGKLAGRPVAISLLVHEINGHRVLFVDATSELVDWKMIDEWLARNMPSSAYRENSQYLNKHDAGNFWNAIPRERAKPLGMQSSFSNHSPTCNRQQNGTFCDCGFS